MEGKKEIIVLGVLFVSIFILGVYLYSNLIDYLSIIEKKEIYAQINVGDHYGINVNKSALTFGTVRPGGFSTRNVTITNSYDYAIRIKIYAKGSIKDFITTPENDFILYVNQTKNIGFVVTPPSGTPAGNYEGKVVVITTNPVVK